MKRRAKGTGRVYQRGSTWWIQYYDFKGERHFESAHSQHRDAAEKLLRQRLEAPVDRKPTVNDILSTLEADYELRGKDIYKMKSHLKPVRERLGTMKAADVTEDTITKYQRYRLESVSKSTINRECQLMGQALKHAYPKIIARPIKIRKLPEGSPREDFFEPLEVVQVIQFLLEYLKDLVRFAHISSWRKQEITTLQWDSISFRNKEILLRQHRVKTRTARVLPMSSEVLELMRRREADKVEGCPYIFHRRGERIYDFRKAWNTAITKAGCAGRVFHALRRSVIRDMVRGGTNERIAMGISGHRTRSIFDRYNIADRKDMEQALARTEDYRDQYRIETSRIDGKTIITIKNGKTTIQKPIESHP